MRVRSSAEEQTNVSAPLVAALRWWFKRRISGRHPEDPGAIPGHRSTANAVRTTSQGVLTSLVAVFRSGCESGKDPQAVVTRWPRASRSIRPRPTIRTGPWCQCSMLGSYPRRCGFNSRRTHCSLLASHAGFPRRRVPVSYSGHGRCNSASRLCIINVPVDQGLKSLDPQSGDPGSNPGGDTNAPFASGEAGSLSNCRGGLDPRTVHAPRAGLVIARG